MSGDTNYRPASAPALAAWLKVRHEVAPGVAFIESRTLGRRSNTTADHRDDVQDLLPVAPNNKNGKKIALVGAGCASLTVANDLMPLGYECVIYEALDKTGGLMRTNIPSFRLDAR